MSIHSSQAYPACVLYGTRLMECTQIFAFKVYYIGRYVVYISHWMERNVISYHPFSDI